MLGGMKHCVIPYGRWRSVAKELASIKSYNTTFSIQKATNLR